MGNSDQLCACGCGQTTWLATKTDPRSGAVKGQPRRYLKGHARAGKTKQRWIVDEETGCWVWQLYVDRNGYGRLATRGAPKTNRTALAHRWMWEQTFGPIPDGMPLDHTCHTRDESCPGGPGCLHRRCVNPEHLEPVTTRENVARSRQTKLSERDVAIAKMLREAGYTYSDIAAKFSVTADNIRQRILELTGTEPEAHERCDRGHLLAGENVYRTPQGHLRCRTCRRDRRNDRAAGIFAEIQGAEPDAIIPSLRAVPHALKTHCLRGHPFDEQNTLVLKDGTRRCRTCHRARSVASWRKQNQSRPQE
jgi:HNH endonuclease